MERKLTRDKANLAHQLMLLEPELDRVRSRLAGIVFKFIQEQGKGNMFYASALCNYVWRYYQCAPESPGRILRQLRLEGYLDYEVVNRAQALYKVTEIAP